MSVEDKIKAIKAMFGNNEILEAKVDREHMERLIATNGDKFPLDVISFPKILSDRRMDTTNVYYETIVVFEDETTYVKLAVIRNTSMKGHVLVEGKERLRLCLWVNIDKKTGEPRIKYRDIEYYDKDHFSIVGHYVYYSQ